MNKKFLLLIFFTLTIKGLAYSQKPQLDVNAVLNWEETSTAELSNDHKFGYYMISSKSHSQSVVKSTSGNWKKAIYNVKNQCFTDNNKYYIYETSTDSIVFINLGEGKHESLKVFSGSELQVAGTGHAQHIIWTENVGKLKKVFIFSIKSEKIIVLDSLVACYFSKTADAIVMVRLGKIAKYSIEVMDMKTGDIHTRWNGEKLPFGIVSAPVDSVMAFFAANDENSSTSCEIIIVDNKNNEHIIKSDVVPDFIIKGGYMEFSSLGKYLIFYISGARSTNTKRRNGVDVNIWNYKDNALPLGRPEMLQKPVLYDIENRNILEVTKADDETVESKELSAEKEFIIVYKGSQHPDDLQMDGRDNPKRRILLRNIKKGNDIEVAQAGYYTSVGLSPQMKFVIYFDRKNRLYKSYEVLTGQTYDLTNQVARPELLINPERRTHPISLPIGLLGWLKDDSGVLICDEYDIWMVDPKGINPAICITGHYGISNCIRLSMVIFDNLNPSNVFSWGDSIWLKGVDSANYKEGFTQIKLKKDGVKDIKIDLAPVHYYWIKKYKNGFLAASSNATTSINWFTSGSLKNFQFFSDVQPQQNYNWFTKELVNYKLSDGSWNRGILYKPENFDPTKKYPVIFHMYEILSDQIYMSFSPRLASGAINPAWMCSQGYLVFQPDISFKMGTPGECAYDAVVSGAKFLSQSSWVDSSRMGLSGVSHGAFSVNYIVTRTNKFAAAAAAAGMVDIISGYNYVRDGASRQWQAETSQERMGGTLWGRPEIYIQNSSIFAADKVQTPLLIMHNRNDAQVPWLQGLEWYLGLRRLGKKVWMLDYEGEGHGVHLEKHRIDYTKRLDQFFGYYLKGEKPPYWLTRGMTTLDVQEEFELDSVKMP